MKRLTFNLLSVILLSAAINASAQDSSTQSRQVSDFNSVASAGPFNVHIKLDGSESIKVDADANIINDIETVVENHTLKIKFKDREFRRYNHIHKAEVYVSAKSLNALTNSGSGSMEVEGTINTEDFKVILSGSGSIRTAVKSNGLQAVISGSGSIKLKGSAENADITISGSGEVDGRNLKTQSAKAVITGSGNIHIAADRSVTAHITGSGNVLYSGNASNVDSRYIGSGRASRED